LRTAVASDPANTFRLIQFFYDLGLYRSAIPASRQVLTLAGMDAAATLNAPIYFNHIRFGTYYKDQVLPLAQEDGFNPLLIFSLMFQESQFEGFIQSAMGARGLMQLMPATAQELVDQSGWPSNYSAQDLYRPVVNLKLGIDYLAHQRQYFDGDLYVMLAGYNGGPGNAAAWKELSGNDPDLFLETVRIQETRDYIMHIVEVFSIYERLYVRNP
jgi:soluble lytic murein transglycosylase